MLPRLLILDDVFGRNVSGGRNSHRENLCGHFLWRDLTDDAAAGANRPPATEPVAEAVFCRAQTPACAKVGDTVENDLEGALGIVRSGSQSAIPWSLVLLDLCFYTGRVTEESDRQTPGMPEGRPGDDDPGRYFGLALLDAIHREFPDLPIFILSSKPREEVSLEFSRRGALGFIARDDLRGPELLQEALWQHGLLPDEDEAIVGHSLLLLLALREARRAALHREPVLIRGERGTGKELIARLIHRHGGSARADGGRSPFVPVNRASVPEDLYERELFGIQPRTSSGVDGKVGLIEMAKGGSLFLDEVGDLPEAVQAALMRVLQERRLTRVGGRESLPVETRFLSSTSREIENPETGLRPDLIDRVRAGGTLWIPSLRDRREDIPLLAERFLSDAGAPRPGLPPRRITSEALERLTAHDWPGNVRELRTAVFDAVTRHPDVEYLVESHFRLEPTRKIPRTRPPAGDRRDAADLEDLMGRMRSTDFASDPAKDWAGQLPGLLQEQHRLTARLLLAAVEATKRRSPECPEGRIRIHPAAKLATGDAELTAAKAADLFKRLLGPIERELEGDLKVAYAIATRLRPKSAKSSLAKR